MSKLAILLSHPVQYYSPLFVEAAKQLELKVFYAFQPNAQQQGKEGFGNAFEWDLDLLSGYEYEFVDNVAKSPSSAYYAGCDTPSIGKRLTAFRATHVITFGWYLKMHRQALRHCKTNGIPIAVRGDSQLDPQLPFWKKFLKKLYYPFFLEKYDAFLSVGKRNKAYLMHYGVPDKKIIFSPHAIDQDFWKMERKHSTEKFRFIWVAKFISKKQPLDAIHAFKVLLDQHPELKERVELLLVGSGPLLKETKEKARNVAQILFPGFKNQSELRAEYAKADCLLLTSDYGETWGLVVNEGFSVGIPAIVSKACGCSADLIDGRNGKTYNYDDIDSLTNQMKTILNWNIEEIQQAKNSIKQKNEVYNFTSIVKSFNRFVEEF
ncbi:MAG: glycosyltransferase family 4 protein [Vicingaceae bacterium]